MEQNCWKINETGFLIHPEPLKSLSGLLDVSIAEQLDGIMTQLPDLLKARTIRSKVDQLPFFDLPKIDDCLVLERAFQIYSYLASAYVFATGEKPSKRIPKSIAVPLVNLAQQLERPPILSYATYTLANWQKIDPKGQIVIENLQLLHKFIHKRDAAWFTLLHVEIEAKAAPAINAILVIHEAISQNKQVGVIEQLVMIHQAIGAMIQTLKRMPEHCHPTVYYHEVRPYIFSFEDVIFEGVTQFQNTPQSYNGETGAQSSVIPALVRLMGLSHEENRMTQYLQIMQAYMPRPHRDFIQSINGNELRDFVLHTQNPSLIEAYNDSLQQLLEFRRLHIRYAASYIANQSDNTIGTGGTEFMTWLQQLITETEAQFLI